MQPACRSIALSEIDWEDERFAIRSFDSTERLERSLEEFGILSPPWFRAQSGSYVILDGFKRLHWLRRNGGERMTGLIFAKETNERDLLLRRIEGKCLGFPLNPAEKAQILSKLAVHFSPYEVASRFYPRLEIHGPPELLTRWLRLAEAGESLLRAAASETVSERSALELSDWPEAARKKALALLKELRCSASIQAEILERVKEIALREGEEREAVLSRPEVADLLEDPERNHRQKTQSLRDILTRWRFPRLKAREERFTNDLRALALPASIRLIPPPAFEGERWNLQITFSDPSELDAALQRALRLARSEDLNTAMDSSSTWAAS